MPEQDELYTVARTVLLDALEALGEHREALVLVGAQAIYLRVGEADLAVASYTTDGDLAIDPRILRAPLSNMPDACIESTPASARSGSTTTWTMPCRCSAKCSISG